MSYQRYITWTDPDNNRIYIENTKRVQSVDEAFREYHIPDFARSELILFTDEYPGFDLQTSRRVKPYELVDEMGLAVIRKNQREMTRSLRVKKQRLPSGMHEVPFPYRLPEGMDFYRQRQYRKHVPVAAWHETVFGSDLLRRQRHAERDEQQKQLRDVRDATRRAHKRAREEAKYAGTPMEGMDYEERHSYREAMGH